MKIDQSLIMIIIGIISIVLFSSISFLKNNDSFAAATVEVKIPNGASEENSDHFDPATVTVGKGTTVEWINDDSTLHTVTSGSPESGNSGTQFDSSYLAADKTYKHTFNKQGTFKYYCTLHPSMTGKVVVSNKAQPTLTNAEKEPAVAIDTTPDTNVNVTQWKNFTDAEQRFSVQFPSHWAVTQSGNRFTTELPLVVNDVNGSNSKVQSQLSINVFKRSQSFNANELAKFASNQLVKSVSGNKLVEPISCEKYLVNDLKACSFLYSGNDKEGMRYGVLTVVVVDKDKSNHMISYRADPLNFDKEQATMDHIIGSYLLLKN
jgi:plastocyanin